MPVPPGQRTALSWVFDIVVINMGMAVVVLAVQALGDASFAHPYGWQVAGISTLLIILTRKFGFSLIRRGPGVPINLDAAFLILLVLCIGLKSSLVVWVFAQALSAIMNSKDFDTRLLRFAISMVTGVCTLFTLSLMGNIKEASLAELLTVTVGFSVYYAVNYLLSTISTALHQRRAPHSTLNMGNGLRTALIFFGVNSLGYLAALVLRAYPGWVSFLMIGPLITILVASRALTRSADHSRRLAALFEAATAVQGISSMAELTGVLRRQAGQVTGNSEMSWQNSPPTKGMIGLKLPADIKGPNGTSWLIAPGNRRDRTSAALDRHALKALVGVAQETTSRLGLLQRLEQQSRRDALTGLPNRLLLTELLQPLLDQKTKHRIAVIYLDLDGFKSVNDRFGHSAGDDLLRRIANRLTTLVGQGDTVARLGADEFALLLTDIQDQNQLEFICRQVLNAIRIPINLNGHSVVLGASVGVCTGAEQNDASELMRNADMAMYRAKVLGKHEYVIYQPELGDERIHRLELIEALRSGISHELVVHYQALVDLQTEKIVGAEALVRWQHKGQLIPPDEFIAAAESSGLIVPLGTWVLAQVVQDMPNLVAAAGYPLELAVNMSAHQLRSAQFPAQVQAACAAFGPSRLVLEMTETVMVADNPHTVEVLQALTTAGAKLAIDDFGVGYSSIGYLQHLPVDLIKIDRSFISDIESGPRPRALIDAILVMGSALSLDVIAEGIERPEQAKLLRDFGCKRGQGFWYAKPQPLPQFLQTLKAGLRAGQPQPAE